MDRLMDPGVGSRVHVFGAGFFGKQLVYALQKNGISVISILDNSSSLAGTCLWDGIPIVKPGNADRQYPVIISITNDSAKRKIFKQCQNLGFSVTYPDLDKLHEFMEHLPDREYLEVMYYCHQGKRLTLDNPQTLNEKLQWLKLHDRNPLYVTLGDKYRVREYLRKKFGEDYLIPLLFMSYDYDDIREENIPDGHCAIKSNCWSGDVEIIRSKKDVDWPELKDRFRKIFESDWSKSGREWWYSRMKPCVIVEKLLETKEGKLPNDYKFHFFNGRLEFVYCSIDREGDNYRKIYSPEWDELQFSWNGSATPPDLEKPNVKKPESFDLMIKMGREIAKDIPYVRVDYYEVDGHLYFGEVTLSHGAGFDRFVPEKYDRVYGDRLDLPMLKGENITNYLERFNEYTVPSHDVWSLDDDKRKTILKLDWNEAAVHPSPKVADAIKRIAGEDYFQYYPDTNNQRLSSEIADYTATEIRNVQYFPSSDVAHEYIAKVWIRKGDKCGILWPTYDNFRATMELADADIVFCDMPELSFDEAAICDFLDQNNCKMFYICNPNNPTGEQISVGSIKRIIDRFPNTLFILDEAYGEFSGVSSVGLIKEYANLVISRTFSKAFGLANLRIGYVISAVDNIRLLTAVRNGKNISTYAQEAAIAALQDKEYMFKYVENVTQARQMFLEEIGKLDYIVKAYPSSANFVMMELKNYESKKNFIDYLRDSGVFIRELGQTRYLREHCCRVTIGTKEQMMDLVNVMKEYTA